MTQNVSPLQAARAAYKPKLPTSLRGGLTGMILEKGGPTAAADHPEDIEKIFPNCYGQPLVEFRQGDGSPRTTPIRIGVVLSGGQAPGGHNVIAGVFDALKSLNPDNHVLGFRGGPQGLIDDDFDDLTADVIDAYRNTGGFDIIGSGRTKLETEEQFQQTLETARRNNLNAIVIIGGDDSNTNACALAEWFRAKGEPIQVVGVPKTIDGDLRNEHVEMSFGFDTAVKVYSELIGNIARDANSARKYWHFIKLMGRSASHITLEAALQTQPNVAIVSEEVAARQMTLSQVVDQIVDTVVVRAKRGKDFGVVLVPEGLIEFIPEIRVLIDELNEILAKQGEYYNSLRTSVERFEFLNSHLSKDSSYCFSSLPGAIQEQLALDRDSHGNVQVSRIETEQLLIDMTGRKLRELKAQGSYVGKFSTQSHFIGYEGRCAPPSNFDADYCYTLGWTTVGLIANGLTGYIAFVENLTKPADEWVAGGAPLTMFMNVERRHGEHKPVIQKALVDLDAKPFRTFEANRRKWGVDEMYLYPGPIQYFGPNEVCDAPTKTLALERG